MMMAGWVGYGDGCIDGLGVDGWMDGGKYGPSSASAPPSQLHMRKLNAIFTILIRLCGGEKERRKNSVIQGQGLLIRQT